MFNFSKTPSKSLSKIFSKKLLRSLLRYRFLLLFIILFILLSLVGIGRGIWFDESYSMYLTRGNFDKIAEMTALDVHPPLYYWLLKIWSLIFGSSTIAFRAMSIFFGVFAIIGVWLLLKRWLCEKTANFATFFLAINPFFLFYATETRMYTLVFVLMSLSTLALDEALKNKSKKCWLIYFILCVAGLYTHYFFAVVIAVQFIYILKHNFSPKKLLIYPALAVAYLPWLSNLLSQVTSVGQGFWIDPVTPETVLQFFSWSLIYFEYPLRSPFYLSLIIITLLVSVLVFFISRKFLNAHEKSSLGDLSMFIFFPPLILTIISTFYVPVYVPRYIIYSLCLLPVLFALFARIDLKNLLSKILAVLIIVCSSFGIYNIYFSSKYNHNEIIETISKIDSYDEEKTSIVISNLSPNYYDAILSETPRHHVLIYHPTSFWGSIIPIKDYNENYLEDFEHFKSENDSFWYIYKGQEEKINGFEIDGYIYGISSGVAVKYTKNH